MKLNYNSMAFSNHTLLLLCFLFLLVKLVLSQPPYELSMAPRVRGSSTRPEPVTLRCRDNSLGTFAEINTVRFWLNRTLPDDPDLRERSDVFLRPGQTGDSLTFTLTRSIEGRYTCGRQIDSANVEESAPVFVVGKIYINMHML